MKRDLYVCNECSRKVKEGDKNDKRPNGHPPPHNHIIRYYCHKCDGRIEKPFGNDPDLCSNCFALKDIPKRTSL